MANAFLDGLMEYRRSRGRIGVSIQWGDWGIGLAGGLDAGTRRRLEAAGVRTMSREFGLAAFDRALRSGATQVMVFPVDWRRFATDARVPPRLRPLAIQPVAEVAEASFPARLRRTTGLERETMLADAVAEAVRAVLRLPSAEALARTADLNELGLDSLMAVDVRTRLQLKLALPLSPSVVLDYPSVARLTRYLLELLAPPGASGPDRPAVRGVRMSDLPPVLHGLLGTRPTPELRLDRWIVRPAARADVSRLSRLEEQLYGWIGPDAVAPAELITDRIVRLNGGAAPWFWLLERDGDVIGYSVTQPTWVDPATYTSWAEATDHGTLQRSFDPDGRYVYGVSRGVLAGAGKAADQLLTLQQLRWMRELGRDTTFACLAMPGFAKSALTPEAYLAVVDENGIPKDWFIQLAVVLYPGRPHLRLLADGYPPDRDSGGHGVSAVWTFDDFDAAILETCQRFVPHAESLGVNFHAAASIDPEEISP